jgi:hypothetical protein
VSAWIVSKTHIDYLLSAVMSQHHAPQHQGDGWRPATIGDYPDTLEIRPEHADGIGQTLADECVKSVGYRYAGSDWNKSSDDLPGWTLPEEYHFQLVEVESPWHALKALSSYSYQSCEHPEWRQSQAYRIVEGIQQYLWNQLKRRSDQYQDGPWDVGELAPRKLAAVSSILTVIQ